MSRNTIIGPRLAGDLPGIVLLLVACTTRENMLRILNTSPELLADGKLSHICLADTTPPETYRITQQPKLELVPDPVAVDMYEIEAFISFPPTQRSLQRSLSD